MRKSAVIIAIALLCILVLTLFPYDFFFLETAATFTWDGLLKRMDRPSPMPLEFLANILLFVPLGFSYTLRLKSSTSAALASVLAISLAVTFTVECLQIFLPDRTPSLWDLVANTAGGGFGYIACRQGMPLLYRARATPFLRSLISYWQQIKPQLAVRSSLVAIALCTYCGLALLGTAALRNSNLWNLSNWDTTYPLLLGNERRDPRPWNGRISSVQIYAQQLDPAAVQQLLNQPDSYPPSTAPIAHYPLDSTAPYLDRTARSPALTWQGKTPPKETVPPTFNTQQWLQTQSPPTELIQQIQVAEAFTLSLTVTPRGIAQTGPARIFSLSQNAYQRNLTLGQSGRALSLRLRSPITKANGQRPEFVIANVFQSDKPRRIVVTYSRQQLAIYIDAIAQRHSIRFSPEMTFFWRSLPFPSVIHLSSTANLFYRLLYRGLFLLPVALLIHLATSPFSKHSARKKQLSAGLITLAAISYGLLEIILH